MPLLNQQDSLQLHMLYFRSLRNIWNHHDLCSMLILVLEFACDTVTIPWCLSEYGYVIILSCSLPRQCSFSGTGSISWLSYRNVAFGMSKKYTSHKFVQTKKARNKTDAANAMWMDDNHGSHVPYQQYILNIVSKQIDEHTFALIFHISITHGQTALQWMYLPLFWYPKYKNVFVITRNHFSNGETIYHSKLSMQFMPHNI